MRAPPIVSARPVPPPIVSPTPANSAARKKRRRSGPRHAARFSNALEPQIIPASCALRRDVQQNRPALSPSLNLHVQSENQRRERHSHDRLQPTPPPARSPKAAKPPSIIGVDISIALRDLRRATGRASIFPASVAKMRHLAHASDLTKQRSNALEGEAHSRREAIEDLRFGFEQSSTAQSSTALFVDNRLRRLGR